MNIFKKTALFICLVAALCLVIECYAAPSVIPVNQRMTQYGTIGVVGYGFPPKMDIDIENLSRTGAIAGGIAGGALTGAAEALNTGLGSSGLGSCSDAACAGAVIIVMGVIATVGLLVGLIGGLTSASKIDQEPAEVIELNQEQINETVYESMNSLQNAIRDRVAQYAKEQTGGPVVLLPEEGLSFPEEETNYEGNSPQSLNAVFHRPEPIPREPPSYQHLASQGIDTVLEVGFTEIWEYGRRIVFRTQVRFLRVSDNTVLIDNPFNYISMQRNSSEWAANGAQPVVDTMESAIHQFAQRIVHDFLLVLAAPTAPPRSIYDEPSDKQSGGGFVGQFKQTQNFIYDKNYLELRPLYPEYKFCFYCDTFINSIELDSLQPTFRWESVTQALERNEYLKGLLQDIDDIRYDIEIFPGNYNFDKGHVTYLFEEVYKRHNLKEPFHKLDTPLQECSEYYWTYRARFRQGDYFSASEWGYQFGRIAPTLNEGLRLISNYKTLYHFKTPCSPEQYNVQSNNLPFNQ